ncbi:Uncharacterised protein [Alloiococcus otitis]|uniref:Transcobalamin-like C-terminal domain-containing protein n=1 Tax=Alloiococcus otitis ATCC 51267 TaxID=883081 RepID=K9E7D8_9LACT|nr:DUF4430 domain-containing protein [Alloiococcus otitis]EKU93104.1 hypothetical protein HMPREF9698_01181 [Alloiococcus otitis ATCC 51267]SUU80738.1 Uncharacterised protein [Alloiococcus otitis]
MKFGKKSQLPFFLILSLTLVACGNANNPEEDPELEEANSEPEISQEVPIQIRVQVDGQDQADLSKSLELEEEASLREVMDEYYQIKEENGYLVELEGIEHDPSKDKYWLFYVNDELAEFTMDEYMLDANDQIDWRLE